MNATFFDGLDELYHHEKFGEDRTTRAGCRCENVVFVTMFFLSVTLRVRSAVRSRVASFEHALRCHLLPDFDEVYSFFHKRLLFQKRYIVLTFVARWHHIFCEIAVKNCKKSKNRRKRLCAPLHIDS